MYTMAGFSHAKPKPRSQKCSIPLTLVFIIKIFSLAALGEAYNNDQKSSTSATEPSISSACKATLYKTACESFLVSLETSTLPATPEELFYLSVQYTLKQAHSALNLASFLSLSAHNNNNSQAHLAPPGAMKDCIELLDDSLDQLSNVINRKNNLIQRHSDVQTWLSAALTNQDTCIESLHNSKFKEEKGVMISTARNLSHHISNSLAFYVSHYGTEEANKKSNPIGRKLFAGNGFPSWVSARERKLLEAPTGEIEAHAVVAKDGSGTHKTIAEAIELLGSLAVGGRNVIYVKAGTYKENLNFPRKRKNVMLVGDGKGKTVIVGSRNADGGWSTFQSATVAAMGDGFIARGITFVNSAGPQKHQAVALRVGSDKSVIFQCSIEGYQDSLYTHSKRQFYRETDIYGTIDFIFGNSAVVFQNCSIFARKPSSGSKNFVTAQGRTDPNQNTGISIHNCKIGSASDLAGSKITYLGRPWQKYSRTVIMQSFIDGSINPAGWHPWSGNFALSTLFYGEYMNSGPGGSTSGRVQWSGYRGTLTVAVAQTFTVGSFIDGNMWLPSTGVSFDSGLIG
ncbi:hypothetical protein P3X46_010472 [Hevea brasiliensis]|uniref:Pectinesterase n=1 Tax=Hevea brasiliensis TaxID=3981 RepID=A0ABQ9MEJ6_HEVBR|nr:pectinesterase-like [Hevea brasiliensis]KAJ9178601.1 hypothetical protein P3X46_010472 [Hevea brasiliensis]